MTIRIALVKQGNRKVQMYLAEVEALWQELDHFRGAMLDECAYQKHTQKDLLYHFLSGLNSEFDFLKSQILNQEYVPSLEQAV